MATKTIGYLADGTPCDYTTFGAFYAAWVTDPDLPAVLTEIIHVQIWYSDALQNNHFNETMYLYSYDDNGFYVKYEGMYGNFINKSCPRVDKVVAAMNLSPRSPCLLRNLAIGTDSGVLAVDIGKWELNMRFLRCNFLGGIYSNWGFLSISLCFILTTSSYAVFCGNAKVNRSIISCLSGSAAIRANYNYVWIISSSIYSTGDITLYRTSNITNSICYSNTLGVSSFLTTYFTENGYQNSCFYQIAYPTKFSDNLTFEEAFGIDAEELTLNSIIADPKFANVSGNMNTIADFALQADSPCRYDNRAEAANTLYPSNRFELSTMGAWTYFDPDFPELENVLTTDTTDGVQGKWVKADTTKYQLDETFGVDGTSETGSLPSPDLPDEADVRDEVDYDNGNLTGTCVVPQAANVRETVPVDATIGTLHVPNVDPTDVRAGVNY